MHRTENKKAQAAIELAVFGAILIFILGTIVRSAVGNSYAQNENFKAMRMAMLDSWTGTESRPGMQSQNISRNSASVLFVEDRLSPDFNKYGDLDRNPFLAQGAGTFSYNVLYPWQPNVDNVADLVPIMDVYINGKHFPFTTAAYVTNTITRPVCPAGGPYPPGGGLTPSQCLQNQCLRNQREWAGGTVNVNQLYSIIPGTLTSTTIVSEANTIFNELANEGVISLIAGTQSAVVNSSTVSSAFIAWLEANISGSSQTQVNEIQSILQSTQTQYKLFYTMVVNGTQGDPPFSSTPPGSCSGTNNALCGSLAVPYTSCPAANINSAGLCVNSTGDMQYDLARNGDYNSVETQFPSGGPMRNYIAWQWAATPGTTAASIGLDTSSNVYPQYDIDGRLKEVTIYAISQAPGGAPTVTYEDYQGGDIDGTWDANSCTPKPGLQSNAQVFTFTKDGTYLQILEGKLYNPETNQFVRSASKRNTIDLIQRQIQLSNNTGRFCDPSVQSEIPLSCIANDCVRYPTATVPNPVEVCIYPGDTNNCFSNENNIKSTCYDENDNMIFVRSRLEDRRGHYWMTDASGQLKVQ